MSEAHKKNMLGNDTNLYTQSVYLISQAAYLYYILGLSQKDVAKKLDLSPSTISRLIKAAKDLGIIDIRMNPIHENSVKLHDQLLSAYYLKEIIIAPVCSNMDSDQVKQSVALEGARYIQRIISDNDILGIAWGGTMNYLINLLNPSQKKNTKFVTLHGSIYNFDYEIDVQTLVSEIAKAFNGKRYGMMVNGLLRSEEAVQIIQKEPNITRVYQMFEQITVSLSGIGSFVPEITSSLGHSGYLRKDELRELKEEGVCGDLMIRFFNKDGKECNTSLKNRTMAIEYDQYQKIPNKIVAASGVHKAQAIVSAINGRLIDTLIVDSLLAQQLLDLAKTT